jgi:predicted GNAT family N-acyltransferase
VTRRVERVDAATVRPLRHAVLRSGRPPEESQYPQDDLPDTLHLAALDDSGDVLACATVFPEPYEGRPAWRLRGMASAPEVRGQGHAGALLAEALRLLHALGAELLWCNARVAALPFYLRFGFTTVGEQFEVVGVPHYLAVLELTPTVNGTST